VHSVHISFTSHFISRTPLPKSQVHTFLIFKGNSVSLRVGLKRGFSGSPSCDCLVPDAELARERPRDYKDQGTSLFAVLRLFVSSSHTHTSHLNTLSSSSSLFEIEHYSDCFF